MCIRDRLSTAQEAAFALDNGNTLFIQTCDSGYDYTLYGPDNKALDGGQLDAPGLTLPEDVYKRQPLRWFPCSMSARPRANRCPLLQ